MDTTEKGTSIIHTAEKPQRAGQELSLPPFEFQGKYYDPMHPPKLIRDTDGAESYYGGKEIDRDTAYSMRFWSRNQPEGLRDNMRVTLEAAILKGVLTFFATSIISADGKKEIDGFNKEKLSAYRKMADDMGYTIGNFRLDQDTDTVNATITKKLP